MALPDEVLAIVERSGGPREVTDADGRLSAASACIRLGLPGGSPLRALIDCGALHPVRDADGDLWFETAELDEVARSGLAESVRAGSYVNVWFDQAELERLDELACDAGLSRADLLRQLVRRSAG
jgi:hypothetical protein